MKALGLAVPAALVLAALTFGCGRDGGGASAAASPPADGERIFMRVLAPEDLLEVDPESGSSRRRRLPVGCGDTPHCLIASGRDLIVSGVGETMRLDSAGPGPDRFKRIGEGWITVPSQAPGTVWLGILDRGRNPSRELSEVREVDMNGEVTRTMTPPRGRWPLQSTDQGLVFQYLQSLRLWSFEERRLTQKLPGPFPADTVGSLLASCNDPCRELAITDTADETSRLFAPPSGRRWQAGYDGAFSPDGSLFAAPVGGLGRSRRLALGLIDLVEGAVEVVPGSHGLERWYRTADFSPSGERLYWSTGRGTLRAYDVGSADTTTVTDLDLGDQGRVMQLVVTDE